MYKGDISHQFSLSHMPNVPKQEPKYSTLTLFARTPPTYAHNIGAGSSTAVFIPYLGQPLEAH